MSLLTPPRLKKSRNRILVVDDENAVRRSAQRSIQSFGFSCETASDGIEALEKIRQNPPDLVLTDYIMPGVTGLDLLKTIQQEFPSIGVVLMTTSVDIQTAIEAIKLGAYEYLLKPFQEDALLVCLERVLVKRTLIQENEHYQSYLEKNFRRYVDPSVLNVLTEAYNFEQFENKKLTATILFCDVRGFTELAESLEVDDLIGQMNAYFFEPGTEIIQSAGGTIDKFIGDGIMAVFGAPVPFDGSAERGVEAAVTLMRVLQEARQTGRHKLSIGIGLATGEVVCGNIGSSKRMDFTVMGNAVNLAARLEKLAGPDMILIDETTKKELRGSVDVSGSVEVSIKGIKNPCLVFQVKPWATPDDLIRNGGIAPADQGLRIKIQ